MKRFIFIIIFLWGSVATWAQQPSVSVVGIEIFFDDDPGVGAADFFDASTPDTVITQFIDVAAESLSPGFHIIGIRVLTDYEGGPLDILTYPGSQNPQLGSGTLSVDYDSTWRILDPVPKQWSLTEYRSFYVESPSLVTVESIDSIEYFFDSDPGVGAASGISITAADSIDISQNLASESLSPGFHVLGMRVRDVNGIWSITDYKAFNVGSSGTVTIAPIDTIEYFFDTDPGVGAATVISIAAADSINLLDSLAAETLSSGFHSLGIRVKDASDNWSITEYKAFIVGSTGLVSVASIDSVEYFFDSDPGVGNASGISVATADSIDLLINLAADTLSAGFHTLGIRVRDVDGIWSIGEYKAFIVGSTGAVTVANIDSIEYFFDTDPGVGDGVQISIPETDSLNILVDLAADTLSPGFHTLGLRVQDVDGFWGIPDYRAFYVGSTGAVSIAKIDSIEYFFDTDPGVGNGTGISVTAGDSINITTDLASDTLSTGFHVVGTRARDEDGNWGITDLKAVYVGRAELVTLTPLAQLEYFYNDDPGFGAGTIIPVSGDSIDMKINIVPPPTAGIHTLTVRVKDANDVWSISEPVTVYSFAEGRDLDSMALVEVYKLNNGTGWTNRTNWTTGNLDTWYGVSVSPVTFRVDSLNLSGNGLTGTLPIEFGYATRLRSIDLSNNTLTDSIPYNFPTYLDSLEYLDVSDNQFNGLPVLTGLTNM